MSSTKVFILVEEDGFYKGLWPFKYIDNLELPVHRPKVPPPFSLAFWFLPFQYIIWGAINFRHCGSHLKRRKPDVEILLRKLNRVVVLVIAVEIRCWIWCSVNIVCRNLV